MNNHTPGVDIFERLSIKIRLRFKKLLSGLKAYFIRLLLPVYFFPLKLITYSAYYLIKFLIKLIFALISLFFGMIIYPFKGLKNFLKSIFFFSVFVYLLVSLFVIADYLRTQYGWYGKFLCSFVLSSNIIKTTSY